MKWTTCTASFSWRACPSRSTQPRTDVVQLDMNETALDAVMSIYDASGRLMWSRTAERWTAVQWMSNWSAGTYHVQVATPKAWDMPPCGSTLMPAMAERFCLIQPKKDPGREAGVFLLERGEVVRP